MSTTMVNPTSTTLTRQSVRRAGAWCLGAGLLGAAQGLAVLAWPPQVPESHFSYPFTGLGFAIAQLSFFLQHLPLIAGVAVLLRLPAVRSSRTARIAIWAAVVGLALLTVMELVAISAYNATTDSAQATLVENLYGPPVTVIGVGLLVAGIALLRQGTAAWAGAHWLPVLVLTLGIYVFVPLTPAIMGPFTAGRLGIAGWMLLFAALGYGLTLLEHRDADAARR